MESEGHGKRASAEKSCVKCACLGHMIKNVRENFEDLLFGANGHRPAEFKMTGMLNKHDYEDTNELNVLSLNSRWRAQVTSREEVRMSMK